MRTSIYEIVKLQEDIMRRDGLELPEVLKCVDSFAEIYVRVVRRWIVKGKYDTSTLVFSLGKSPYIFPPEIIYEENGKQKKLLNFELPYKKEEERSADSDISDINMYIGWRPEFLEPIQKRFGEHLQEISEKSVLDLERPKEKEHMKLTMQGFYKEMDYYRTSLSIYDNIREKGNREEEKICNYLNEGVMLIQTPVRVRDVVNRENGVIGNFGLRTDGVWMCLRSFHIMYKYII